MARSVPVAVCRPRTATIKWMNEFQIQSNFCVAYLDLGDQRCTELSSTSGDSWGGSWGGGAERERERSDMAAPASAMSGMRSESGWELPPSRGWAGWLVV